MRNPEFDEWSAAAQPDGFPDRIVWTFGMSGDETKAIEGGRADWMADSPTQLADIMARHARQVHVDPLFGLGYLAFNVREAPFDDPRVRRAVSFAADRGKVVSLLGGHDAARPSCQILPPGIPGYRPYCPFTTDPGPTGAWVGPDVARARRLVDGSPTRRHESDGVGTPVLLRRGDRRIRRFTPAGARVRVDPPGRVRGGVRAERQRFTTGRAGLGRIWIADYPSASDFFGFFFRCSAFRLGDPAHTRSASFFCRPHPRPADGRGRSPPDQRSSEGRQAVGRCGPTGDLSCPWVPLVNFQIVDFVSARVGNYQFHPLWGILLDQLWVR